MAMADGYGLFWNSDSGDRKYDAKSFEKWLKKFFTSGVFEGDLQVLASSGMTVQVQTGYSNLNGKVGLFESATNVTLSAANSRYPRIDTIIIERNDVDRVIQIDKVTGAYTGENPQPTAPIWDETQGIYQLVLAQIYVGAGVSSISQEDITDKRTDTDVCGYIAGTVNEMDFSQFTAQFEAYFSTFEATQLAEFETWFEHMKDQLDSDAAGHLQGEIDGINTALNDKAPKSHASTDTTYGIGTPTKYGHCKTINALTQSSHADGTALSAYQGKVLNDKIGNLSNLNTTDKSSAVAAINEVNTKVAKTEDLISNSGDAYDPTRPYKVGELCIYNNVLYRCTTACSAGSWATNRSCFTADTLVNIVSSNSNFMLITDQTLSDPKAVIESHWDEIPTTNHQQLICIVTSVYTYYAIVGKYNSHYSAVKLYGYGEDDTSYKIVVGQRFNDVWKWRSLKFGSRESVTALQSNNGTWVATEDGFIHVTTSQPASGVVYIYLYEGDSVIGSIALQNGTGGLTHAFTVPVQKKLKYKILFSGVSSIDVDFRPLYS